MKYKVTLNGRTYEVEVEAGKAMLLDEYEAIAPAAPATAPAAAPAPVAAPSAAPAASLAAGEPVKAPMPGVVLKVQVQQGQAVKAGQVLVILEAMKMENSIMSDYAGTVKQVLVAEGETVAVGQPVGRDRIGHVRFGVLLPSVGSETGGAGGRKRGRCRAFPQKAVLTVCKALPVLFFPPQAAQRKPLRPAQALRYPP